MSSSIAHVKKLRGKRLRELRARRKQGIAKLSERVLLSATTEMSDSALLAWLKPAARNGSAEATARLVLESDSLAMRGSLAFARFSSGRFLRGFLVRGSRLEAAGQIELRSPVALRWCAIQMNDGRAEITIHGGDRFDLSFANTPRTILINKAPFAVSRNCRSAAFARQGSGWELIGND